MKNNQHLDLAEKVVLITGASRGIGAQLALGFAQQGAYVVINYLHNHELATEVVQSCQAVGSDAMSISADVSNETATKLMIDNVLSEFGRIDVLVNNAFAPYQFDPESRKPFLKMGWSDFENQIKGSLGAVVNVTNAVLEPFLKLGSGSIINIASNLVQRPVVPYHDYISAKSGVISLTKSLAVEMGPYGIRVNAVCPGWVYPSASSMKSKEKSRDILIEQTPLGRLAQSTDIVGPVLFLASQWSGFMTGQVLYVDGGYTMPNG